MRRRLQTIQQARFGQQQRAGADGEDQFRLQAVRLIQSTTIGLFISRRVPRPPGKTRISGGGQSAMVKRGFKLS